MSRIRKTAVAVALTALAATGARAALVGDTLVMESVSKVKIETQDTVQRIVISGTRNDPQFHYVQRIAIADSNAVRRKMTNVDNFNKVPVVRKENKKGSLDIAPHLLLGLGTMTGAPDGYNFRLWPSFELGITVQADWHPFGPHNVWSTGLGYMVRNYRLSADSYWTKDATGMMTLAPYDKALQRHTKTTLHTFSLQVPLLYTHRFDNDGRMAFTLGAIVNVNTGAHATRRFTQDGEDYNIETKGIGQRPVTIDAVGMLKIPNLPVVYCRYCPMTLFRDKRGPDMHQLSFGIYF